jgi:rod shape-determining protein MreC
VSETSSRSRWLLGLCILISLILAWGDSSSDGSWRRFFAQVISPLDKLVADVSAAFRSREQNALLTTELARSRQIVWQEQNLLKENDRLNAILALRSTLSYESIPARVINYQTDGLRAELTLDVGQTDGIKPDMAVLAPEGLVGRVVRVYPHTSLVRLITDPEERVSCRVYKSRSFCVLRTDELGRIRLDYLSSRAEVEKGDAVVTSGLGGVYPAGVPVGSIENLELNPEQLFFTAFLKPYVNFSALELVVVAQPAVKPSEENPAMPAPSTAPAPLVHKPATPRPPATPTEPPPATPAESQPQPEPAP